MGSISINERVERIKGNNEEINLLIEEYKPFIASCVQKSTGKYVRYGEDDELSIGLIAFAEAINDFDSSKGNFLSFAANVINRRLVDYYRKEKKHEMVLSLDESNEEDYKTDYSIIKSIDNFNDREINELRKQEIEEIKKELAEWNITFSELVHASPKHVRTKKLYQEIIRFLLSRPDLLEQMKERKQLPVIEIQHKLKVSRKKIERSRKYIIAVIIIFTGDYQYIRDYVDWW